MVNDTKNCYLCGSGNLDEVRNRLRYDIQRSVLQCADCGINYLQPEEIPQGYYQRDYRKMYTPVLGKALTPQEVFDVCFPYQQARIDELRHILNKDMKVLDIGCSTGHFLHALKDNVSERIGIELNEKEAEFARENLGICVHQTPLDQTDISHGYFDMITVFQALEHMDDPLSFLKSIYPYLAPDGVLVIEVPNVEDALLSLYQIQEYQDFWYREPHVFNYSKKALEMTLKKTGFEGTIKTTQSFNLINHMNWILNHKPQASNSQMSKPVLVESENVDKKMRDEFNQWFKKVDDEYKAMLNKYSLGENLLFIGRRRKK